MKKTLIKLAACFVVFLLSLIVISGILNRGNTGLTTDMAKASLPVVYMNVNDEYINVLHGYTVEMEGSFLRGDITPVNANRKLSVKADTFGASISKLGYELRTVDGQRLIEDTELESFVFDNNIITADFEFKDLIEEDKEYMLVIKLTGGDGNIIRYYTRIINTAELYLDEKLAFIHDFSDRTFSKEDAETIKKYMESNADGDNSSFAHVDIHSNFRQLTWGDLEPVLVGEKYVHILEIDNLNASIMLDYQVRAKNDLYNISEFFRLKRGSDRIYLMEYDRTMDQIFDPDTNPIVKGKVVHGILSRDIQYMENSDASVYVFVQENSLYSYNISNGQLARIFSFYDKNNSDIRTSYDQHGIKVLSVDSMGNVNFLVYGYMNRGRYEGRCGAVLYYYDPVVNTIEEQLFIPYYRSYGILNRDVELLSYVNRRGQMYIMLDGSVLSINIESKTAKAVAGGLDENKFVSTTDNSIIAWQAGSSIFDHDSLQLFELNSTNPTTLNAPAGNIILPLGFIDDDFVYGLAYISDLTTNEAGRTMIPMHKVVIRTYTGEVLKEYSREDMYVTDVDISDEIIRFSRVTKDPATGMYYATSDDQILNNETESISTKNKYMSLVTDEKETTYQTVLAKEETGGPVRLLTPGEVIYEGDRTIIPDVRDETERYYVYARNSIEGIYTDSTEAVIAAGELFGVVVDSRCEYIWESGHRKSKVRLEGIEAVPLSEEEQEDNMSARRTCINEILKYEGIYTDSDMIMPAQDTVMNALEDNLKDKTVIDLTGCPLSSVLYYVSRGKPVLVLLEDDAAVLIVGYDSKNTLIFDPLTGSTARKGMNDSASWFESRGNKFISYVD